MRPVPFRTARGLAVGGVGVLLALAAHGLAGGAGTWAAPTAVSAVAVLTACVVASSRPWTLPRVLSALVAVQALVHGVSWLVAGTGEVDPRLAGVASHAATGHSAVAHHPEGQGPGMLAAHAGAVLLAGALLARIDQVVLRLWQLGRTVLGACPARLVLRVELGTAIPRARLAAPRGLALLVSPRRGPPRVPLPG